MEVDLIKKTRKHEFFDGDVEEVELKLKTRYRKNGNRKDREFTFKFAKEDGVLTLGYSKERDTNAGGSTYTGTPRMNEKTAVALNAAVDIIEQSNIDLEVVHPMRNYVSLDYECEALEDEE